MTLENAPQSTIDVCHFIPKSTKPMEVGFGLLPIACSLTYRVADSQLSALEYNIGLRPRSLNVNTAQNIDFRELFYPSPRSCFNEYMHWPAVRSDLHRSFDRSDWALIPSTDLLTRIEQRVQSFVQARDGGAVTLSDMYDEVDSFT